MQLVQISDLHVGAYNAEILLNAIDEINRLEPDVILVTGDLTENGLLVEFKKAKEYISMLKCSNIIVLAGNHDYRHTGYLLFKRMFYDKQLYELDECIIAKLNTARPDRDEGEVGYRQCLWLANSFKRDYRYKIIAMHHHLIAAPDTGSDRIIVLDAGDVLHTALSSNVNLVICGHKHRPWLWNLGSLIIAYAGTVSSIKMRGFFENSYNIIDIDDTIKIDLKIVNGERMPLEKVVRMREYIEE
ncbi:MAG: metallophosphoesterase family protein [Candidatus Nitrosocaldaceae archaeon]